MVWKILLLELDQKQPSGKKKRNANKKPYTLYECRELILNALVEYFQRKKQGKGPKSNLSIYCTCKNIKMSY